MDIKILNEFVGFQWDRGNLHKNQQKHGVLHWECEQVFFNDPILQYEDKSHSAQEKRIYVLGRTDDERKLFIAFTTRNNLIRIISARDMSQKERKIYDKIEKNSEF